MTWCLLEYDLNRKVLMALGCNRSAISLTYRPRPFPIHRSTIWLPKAVGCHSEHCMQCGAFKRILPTFRIRVGNCVPVVGVSLISSLSQLQYDLDVSETLSYAKTEANFQILCYC